MWYTPKTEKIFSITHIFKNINIYPSVLRRTPPSYIADSLLFSMIGPKFLLISD